MPFERDSVLGKDCILYYNTGTHATPVWVPIPHAKDVKVDPLSKGKAEQKARLSKFNFKRGTHIEMGLSFGYDYEPGDGDTVFPVLLDSFLNNTPIEFFAADGDASTEGTQGPRMVCEVFECPLGQELDNPASVEISAEITRVTEGGSVVEPDWYTVPAA
ncbi:hypothetical protein DTL21_07965 [Bremerella cremea]|uniref:Phage tail protein n=1 Tax=Blastopirellula marina TaxID=124 RepID=A0A2S8FUL1_9BACT|nr:MULTISPECIES: hypothetical protein [Pirellulaceae]PQO35862.1 hypothetical protein C5Y83_07960 [Blastopirellula marina]RCS48539.1 hypothetical protein DTL21_07965 [Bremerella cremea]